jgi:phosphopantothenoylcysteine decarboxylase
VANVLLGITGSVAALKTPELFACLKRAGHQVRVVATKPSLYFFDPKTLDPNRLDRNPAIVIIDEDEWPGRDEGQMAQRGDAVLHIELRKWADLLVIAPLDANTLAKLAQGLADNCLTCVWRAWDQARPVVLAPAMNSLMWEHPATRRHLLQLASDAGAPAPPSVADLLDLVAWINRTCARLHVVPPQSKRLFCGDVGVGAMAELVEILEAVARQLSKPTEALPR